MSSCRCRGTKLSACSPEDKVVADNGGDVHIASCGVDEVVSTDDHRIAVPLHRDHGKLWPKEFDSCSVTEWSPMESAQHAIVEGGRLSPAAVNSHDEKDLILMDPYPINGSC